MTDNKRIAKNTLFMYFRMILVMGVSLFTSRVVLRTLGVEDFGTYQVVGGIVGFLSFINITLSSGTSRFLMFEMGHGDRKRLELTFSTLLSAHIVLAVMIVFLAETIGLWFVYNKLVIPANRMDAAVFTYHLSILTAFLSLTQAPYSSSIKSHERMDIYAYSSIIDVSVKLAIVYLLLISPIDKLKFYALLLAISQIGMNLYYRWFCVKHFEECKYHFQFNKKIFKRIAGYCSWNLFSHTAGVLNAQGMIILLNMFFNAGVVTAMAVATTVKNAANSFVENYRLASVPQIVKQYAAGEFESSRQLLLSSTKYSFFLLYVLGLPIFLAAPELLKLWLGIVPSYSVSFLRLIILLCMVENFNSCFYTAIDAKGQIKEYSIVYPIVMFLCFPIVYISFKLGYSPLMVSIVLFGAYSLMSFVIMPILIIKIGNYKKVEIFKLFKVCFLVTLLSAPIPTWMSFYISNGNIFIRLLWISVISFVCVGLIVWFVGMERNVRQRIVQYVRCKIER